ncbi:MAG: tyrosine-type recombinase/integrase [Akkermansia sp.]
MNHPLDSLMEQVPLSVSDAVRLCLELLEEAGLPGESLPRAALLSRMRRVIRAGAEALRREEHTVCFAEAAWASVRAREHRRPATYADLCYFVRRMLRVPGVGARPLRAMTARECRELLEQAFPASVHSYRKGRAILHSVFAFGFRREWCDANPVDRVEVPEVREREVLPLSPQEVARLEQTAELPPFRSLRLPLHLMLYCGIRPTEVSRLDPCRDIDWRERTVTIRPNCSKTGGGRVVPLRGGDLSSLPRSYPPGLSPALWRRFRRRAGFARWVPDVLRHTFASYHAVYFRNLALLQQEMGHRDVSLLRTRYVHTVGISARCAAAFWRRPGADHSSSMPMRRCRMASSASEP